MDTKMKIRNKPEARDNGKKLKKVQQSSTSNLFSEIVINKYFLPAAHFITKLPKKLPFSAKSSFTYC